MSNPKIVEIRSSDPAINASIKVAADLASQGIPFVSVPCFTAQQVDAARALGLEHWSTSQAEKANH